MSKKQQIESSITPELTPIKERLLECAKKGQPVLLHGQDTIGREELFLQAYEASGGTRRSNECFIANDAVDLCGNPVKILEPSPNKEKMEMRWEDNTCGYIDYGCTVGYKELKYSLNKRFAVYV